MHAQVSGSVGVVSDYRYRGYSLSDGDPALQASIAFDAASGAYAGLFASSARYGGESGVQWIPYAGFARRDAHGRSWDVGVRWSHFSAEDDADYAELHAGVALRGVALRVHYAPDYFGQVSTAYFEVDGSVPFGERVRGVWHVGLLRSGEAPEPDDGGAQSPYRPSYARRYASQYREFSEPGDRTRLDVRAGVAIPTRLCEMQVTWQHVDGGEVAAYRVPWNARDRAGWVVGCVKRW